MKKRLLSLLLAICMLLTLLPTAALASEPTRSTQLDLTASSISYNTEDGGSAIVNPTDNNITDSIEGWAWYTSVGEYVYQTGGYDEGFDSGGVLVLEGLELEYSGSNALSVPANTTIMLTGSSNSVTAGSGTGLYAKGSLTILGGGSLNVTGGSYGITVASDPGPKTVTIKSGSLTATGRDYSGSGIGRSYGIDASVVLSGGTLTATGGNAITVISNFAHSRGITGSVTVTDGELTATAGTVIGADGSTSFGIGKGGSITGGIVNARGATQAIHRDSSLTIGSEALPATIENACNDFGFPFTESKGVVGTSLYGYDGEAYDPSQMVIISFPAAKELTPTATFTATGPDRGTLSGVTDGMKYQVGSGAWTDITANTSIDLTGLSACTISVVKKGNGSTADSDPQIITVTRAATPTTAAAVHCTTTANNDGKLTGVAATMEYQQSSAAAWTAGSGSDITGLTNGTYYVRVKAAGTVLASAPQTLTINDYDPAKEPTPNATFTATGPSTGTLSGVTDGMKYQVGSGAWTDITANTSIDLTGLSACTISVVKKGNGSTTADSDPQTINVTKAATPTTAGAVGCTTSANNDGKLTGVTATMEYQKSGVASWTAGTGSDITGLTNGTYYIRVKVAGTVLASDPQTVTINAYVAPTSSGGGGYTPPTYDVPVSSNKNSINATATVANSSATITINESKLNTLLNDGDTTGSVSINAGLGKSIETALLPATVIDKIAAAANDSKKNITGLTVTLDSGTVELDKAALAAVCEQGSGSTIAIRVEEITTAALNSTQRASMAGEHANDLIVEVTVTSGGCAITDYDGGKITVTVPYELKEGEQAAGVCVWHLDRDGKLEVVECRYDAAAKTVSFETDHLLVFTVGYNASKVNPGTSVPDLPFADVDSEDWFFEVVRYAYETGLMVGTGSTTFEPLIEVNRAMLVTTLCRLEGEPTFTVANPFDDVVDGQWYTNAIIWAAENEIVAGYGGGKFGPTDTLTREQMVAILYSYARYKGYDVSIGEETNILSYADAEQISEYAIPAMQWACGAGLIYGDGVSLAPRAATNRAQIAAVLQRFIENVTK